MRTKFDGDRNDNRQLAHTRSQRKLARAADRLLAKAGFYDETIEEGFGIDADMITGRSGLAPKWHGRA